MTKNIKNMQQYIQKLMDNGQKPIYCIKVSCVKARESISGETIVTHLQNTHKETENSDIKKGNMVVTNPRGEQYVVKADVFKNKYKKNPDNPLLYHPTGEVQQFIKLGEDLAFKAPWGQNMYMKKGDFINITYMNEGDIYGVAQEEFFSTYKQCTPEGKLLHK